MSSAIPKYSTILWCLTLILLFNHPLGAQEQPLAREINVQRQDSVFKYTYYFDDNRNKVVENKSVADDIGVFYPVERTEWVYEAGQCVSQRESKRENNSWQTTALIQTIYDGDYKVEEIFFTVSDDVETIENTIVYQYQHDALKSVVKYNGSKESRHIAEETLFHYDDNQRVSKQIISNNPALSNDSLQLIEYKYNLNMQLDSIICYTQVDNKKFREFLTIYQYDKLTEEVSGQTLKRWDEITANWKNLTKSTLLYGSNHHLIRELYYHHDGLFWKPNTQYEYIYDTDELLAQKIMYQPIHNQWRKIFTIDYSDKYNNQPNTIESTYNFWGGETGSAVNTCIPYYFNGEMTLMDADRIEIKYMIDTTVITQINLGVSWLKIYPNPSDGLFYISPQDHCIDHWKVYNSNGMLVKSNVNQYFTGIVDLTNLPDGMYLVSVTTDDNQQLKQKVIIQRNH